MRYKIFNISVYDGDTITADIDLGFGLVITKQKIRLCGLDTPEVRGTEKEEGIKVRDDLIEKLKYMKGEMEPNPDYEKCKYGRWLATIYNTDGENINKWLLDSGRATHM